jgi:hypothetical protein
MIGFVDTFFYNLSYSQSIIALPLIYPLHKSLGHAIRFLATIYPRAITSNHHEVLLSFLVQLPWTAEPPGLDPIPQF